MTGHLIGLNKVCLAYGLHPLLHQTDLHLFGGERVCLIGRNGAGKSSLLKIISDVVKPDSGTVYREPGIRIASLSQELPDVSAEMTVYEFVATGLAELGQLLTEYHALIQEIAHSGTASQL